MRLASCLVGGLLVVVVVGVEVGLGGAVEDSPENSFCITSCRPYNNKKMNKLYCSL
jgi:hypothetical protein